MSPPGHSTGESRGAQRERSSLNAPADHPPTVGRSSDATATPLVTLSDTPARFDFARVHVWLATETHWAHGIDRATVERAFANSLAVGAFAGGVQVGVARAVTDAATFAYLCDVFVDRAWRGRGVARRMVLHLLHHPRLAGLRRVVLRSRDARGLYARLGFGALPEPEIWMERPAVPSPTA